MNKNKKVTKAWFLSTTVLDKIFSTLINFYINNSSSSSGFASSVSTKSSTQDTTLVNNFVKI